MSDTSFEEWKNSGNGGGKPADEVQPTKTDGYDIRPSMRNFLIEGTDGYITEGLYAWDHANSKREREEMKRWYRENGLL